MPPSSPPPPPTPTLLHSFKPSSLPGFLHSFTLSFLPVFRLSFLPSFRVSFRPSFSPEGIVAHGMYAGYGACAPCDAEYRAKANQRLLLYAGLLATGFLVARAVSPKKNPRKKMKTGERIVRVGSGLVLGGIGALGWMGPQAIEPVSTIVGVPTSLAGAYLVLSGITSPETASQIRKEATGG